MAERLRYYRVSRLIGSFSASSPVDRGLQACCPSISVWVSSRVSGYSSPCEYAPSSGSYSITTHFGGAGVRGRGGSTLVCVA